MRKLLALALLLIATIAQAQQNSTLAYTWCIDITFKVWGDPLFTLGTGTPPTPVYMRTSQFRIAVGRWSLGTNAPAALAACEAYRQAEVASAYMTPDPLAFLFTWTDPNGNPQQASWALAQLSPVPDGACTIHYFS